MKKPVDESVQDIKGIRSRAISVGILAGFGVAYLASFIVDIAANPPLFYWGLMIILLPFVVLGIVALILWTQTPLSARNAQKFVIYFWIPFFFLYGATYAFYWIPRM